MEDTLAAIRFNNVGPSGTLQVWLMSADNNYATFNVIKDTMIPVADALSWGFYSLFSDGDVMAIRTRNTRTGMIMVYVLTADSEYKEYDVDTPTPIPVSDAPNWVFRSADGYRDVFGIRIRNTGTSQVKMYVLSRGSNYTEYMVDGVDIPIPLSEADDYVYFTVKRDLVCFRIRNTRNVEASVFTAESDYQDLRFRTVTPIPVAEAGNYVFTHYYSEGLSGGYPVEKNIAQLINLKGPGISTEIINLPGHDRPGLRYNARNRIISTELSSVWRSDFVFAGN